MIWWSHDVTVRHVFEHNQIEHVENFISHQILFSAMRERLYYLLLTIFFIVLPNIYSQGTKLYIAILIF